MSFKKIWPIFTAIVISSALAFVIRPTGDFPLNDDWQYSHVAKTFAESGVVRVDVPVAPSLVLQTWVGGALAKIAGFSHFKLRLLSFFVGLLVLFLIDRILVRSRVRAAWRFLALLNCLLNPLFLHFQWSFMTELYGYAIQLAGLWVWLKSREKSSRLGQLGGIALVASSFWVRQFCVLLIPCLFVADFFQKKRDREFYLHWTVSAVTSAVIVGGYFYWVRVSGNFKPQFAFPLSQLLDPDAGLWLAQTYVFSAYFLFFLAPFMLFFLPRYREVLTRGFWRWGAVAFILVCIGVGHRWTIKGTSGYDPKSAFNHVMPYLGNVITPIGVGPVTTTDVYIERSSQLAVSSGIWVGVTLILFLLLPTLIFLFRELRVKLRDPARRDWVLVFSCAMGVNLFFAIQAYHRAVFDRYYFPSYLGGLLLLAWATQRAVIPKKIFTVAVILQTVMGGYAVLGMHDYFRWNEARWEIVAIADQQGKLADLDGGFEVNGILHYEGWGSVRPDVRAHCGPKNEFFCHHLPYQIAWSVPAGAQSIAEKPINGWMYRFPPLLLIHKLIPATP